MNVYWLSIEHRIFLSQDSDFSCISIVIAVILIDSEDEACIEIEQLGKDNFMRASVSLYYIHTTLTG